MLVIWASVPIHVDSILWVVAITFLVFLRLESRIVLRLLEMFSVFWSRLLYFFRSSCMYDNFFGNIKKFVRADFEQ